MCELYLWIASALASCAPASAYDRLAAANAVRSRRGARALPPVGQKLPAHACHHQSRFVLKFRFGVHAARLD